MSRLYYINGRPFQCKHCVNYSVQTIIDRTILRKEGFSSNNVSSNITICDELHTEVDGNNFGCKQGAFDSKADKDMLQIEITPAEAEIFLAEEIETLEDSNNG